jgi:hypothetical protein
VAANEGVVTTEKQAIAEMPAIAALAATA